MIWWLIISTALGPLFTPYADSATCEAHAPPTWHICTPHLEHPDPMDPGTEVYYAL